MKIIFNNFDIHYENISFMETKKNIIMEGIFTKIIFSDTFVTMNGLYILIPLLFNSSSLTSNHSSEIKHRSIYNKSHNGISHHKKITTHIGENEDIEPPYGEETNVNLTNNQYENIKYNNYLYFYSYTPHNLFLIKKITELETRIIEYYKAFYGIRKKNALNLSDLLNTGRIKLYKDDEQYTKKTNSNNCPSNSSNPIINYKKSKVVLKISGVWETNTDVGLTYKFIEMQEYNKE